MKPPSQPAFLLALPNNLLKASFLPEGSSAEWACPQRLEEVRRHSKTCRQIRGNITSHLSPRYILEAQQLEMLGIFDSHTDIRSSL